MVEEGDLDDKLEDKATNEVVDDVKKVKKNFVRKFVCVNIFLGENLLGEHFLSEHFLLGEIFWVKIFLRENFSIKHDLARSCFKFWLKIGDEGDKISKKNWRGAS